MATAKQVLDIASAEIGVTEYPPNSNRVKYWDAFAPYWQGEPWCARFISWCGWRVGASGVVGVFDYCPYWVNWFKSRGQWIGRDGIPQPGDIIFFGNKGTACHVGIVEKRNGSSSVTTIEGNTSSGSNANGGRVERRERTYGTVGSTWYILGFGRPKYESEDEMPSVEDLWNYQIDGVSARDRLKGVDWAANEARNMLADTSDPTGRAEGMSIHDQVRWMASKQAKMVDEIAEIKSMLADFMSRS